MADVSNPNNVSNPELGLNYPGFNYTPNTPAPATPAATPTPSPVATTSNDYRAGVAKTGTAITDGLSTNVGNSLLSGFDSAAITGDYNTVTKNLQDRSAQLKTERDQELANINSSFDVQKTDLTKTQANETGAQSNTLARIGGYLGDNASGMGAAISLQNLHVQQIQSLEAKRQAALLDAQKAYNDGDYKLADQMVQESKQYHSDLLAAQKQYADQSAQQVQVQKDKLALQQAAQDFALKYDITDPFYSIGGVTYSTKDLTPVTSQEQYAALGGKGNMTDVKPLSGNTAAERDQVLAMAAKYPDAGILPTDNIAAATLKLKQSATYKASIKQFVAGKDAMGNPISMDASTGKWYNMAGDEVTPVTTSNNTGLLDAPSVNAYLTDKTPDQIAAFNGMTDLQKSDVMQLTNGDVLLSDLMASRGVQGSAARQQLLMEARMVDPAFSENVNKQRYAFKNEWNNANGKAYNTRTAINAGLGHLATLKELTNQLSGNSDFKKANSIEQFINQNINGPNAEIVAKFQDTVNLLAGEIAKAYKGGVPDKDEIAAQVHSLSSIAPSNITSAIIDNKAELMTSLLKSTAGEYKNVMGEFPEQVLHTDVLDKLQNAGVDTQGITKTLIQEGMHASSIHDYVAAFPDKAAAAEKILRENPNLSDDDVLQILQPDFSNVGADTQIGSNQGTSVEKTMAAIGQYESGGNYKALGKPTASGDVAYGKYQVMGANIPQWTKEALGHSLTPQQFLDDPAAQDKVAQYKMGKLIAQGNSVEDVASIWFSGRPMAKAGNAKDVNGTSVPKYVANVRALYNKA